MGEKYLQKLIFFELCFSFLSLNINCFINIKQRNGKGRIFLLLGMGLEEPLGKKTKRG